MQAPSQIESDAISPNCHGGSSDTSPVVDIDPSPPPDAAMMPSNEELLLREWNDGASAGTMDAPPVAPAVVLNETSTGSNTTSQTTPRYSYPVATFVSNLVRTSVSELRDHIIAVTAVPEDLISSTRSAPATARVQATSDERISTPRRQASPERQRFLSSDQEDNETALHESGTEYVLIDGDLVAIPAIHEQYMDDYDARPGRQQRQERRQQRRQVQRQQRRQSHEDRNETERDKDDDTSGDLLVRNPMPNYTQSLNDASCRPSHSRVHRGMRKVKKWIKKKQWISNKKAKEEATATSSNDHVDELAEESVAISTQSPNATNVAAFKPRKKSPPRPQKTRRRKSRRGWALRDTEGSHDHEAHHEGTEVEFHPASNTISAQQEISNFSQLSTDSCGTDNLARYPNEGVTSLVGSSSLPLSFPLPADADGASLRGSEFELLGFNRHHRTHGVNLTAALDVVNAAPPPIPAHGHYRTPSGNLGAISASLLPPEHESPSLNRQASIAAEYVGFVPMEQIDGGNILPDHVLAAEAYIEDRLDDYDKYDKKDIPISLIPRDTDFKVDKLDAPCVDSMLRRAGEFSQDMDDPEDVTEIPAMAAIKKGKSDGESIPLSMATGRDAFVHNDILKIVMAGDSLVDKSSLARALRQSTKKPRRKRATLGVDVHSWTPPNDENVRFTIWDVQGTSHDISQNNANFGAHPGTQSLFFSDRALYLLVWDLAVTNRKTYHRFINDEDEDDLDEDDEGENEYLREEANRQAELALLADIEGRVLSWVDCIARRGNRSAILPVALVSGNMSPSEAKRRCDAMQTMLMKHIEGLDKAPKVLSGAETVLCVSLETDMGMELLKETILAIATDANHSVFDHVGTPVPLGTSMVLETCKKLKQEHKLVLVDRLLAELQVFKGEMGMVLSAEEVMTALHFLSSIGECMYFGGMDDILSHYVILSRKWLVSALSCILRNDLKRELSETRRFMNMQSFYSDRCFAENPVTQVFSGSTSLCPLLSSSDTQMLWQSMSFMREAVDITSQAQEHSTTNSTMFGFLEHLLVHTGVFLPLDIDRLSSPDVVYFVPSLLAPAITRDVWTYKSSEAWMTTLAHSWLFRTPGMQRDGLMENITVALLRDLYEFSHLVASKASHSPPSRSQTFPFAPNGLVDFIDCHDGEAIGHVKIHQMMCWQDSLLIKIGCVFPEGVELRESFVEIFVTFANPVSPFCVASDIMHPNMQRLIVSGKGQVGHHGRKLWRGGYRVVLDSIKSSVADHTNLDLQVVCPECLAHSHPSSASTWSWDAVRAAAESGSSIVRCMRGHRADSNLLCGTARAIMPKADGGHSLVDGPKKSVKEIMPSIVLIGLFDLNTNSMRSVGSGFIVDKKQGLVVTAGHVLFDMNDGENFGTPFLGLQNSKVVIGLIAEDQSKDNNNVAVFRYSAKVVADDLHSMDACVLRIVSRFIEDVDDESRLGTLPEKTIADIGGELLPSLKTTRKFELEENVRILGFNQAGEGWLEQGKHVNRTADFAKGYICKLFKRAEDHDFESDSDDSSSSSEDGFAPREEIVVICPTIPGHSGSPAVNSSGAVVGLLSRADPVDPQRCYLVPSSELKLLVNQARKASARVGSLKLPY